MNARDARGVANLRRSTRAGRWHCTACARHHEVLSTVCSRCRKTWSAESFTWRCFLLPLTHEARQQFTQPLHAIDDVMHVVQLGFEVVAQLRVQRVERGHAAPKVTVFRCFIRARCEGAEDHVQVGASDLQPRIVGAELLGTTFKTTFENELYDVPWRRLS